VGRAGADASGLAVGAEGVVSEAILLVVLVLAFVFVCDVACRLMFGR
jgi:hypothetical protein